MEICLKNNNTQAAKSLELFFQELCDRTYEITLERGAKTVSSLHLKHCVETYNEFDFQREVVSKVPDYGQAQGQGQGNATIKRWGMLSPVAEGKDDAEVVEDERPEQQHK
ncbi:unnamed protein product [Brassica rapa]|uniref:Transcription factor CBF/NF-Y/archaeal histone domain-containing protein n=1 Tax=Brassica campestris TaxID=3711 RepID=A0A8D9GCX4_BRACM|nr:unnamed protein product [Brassica rapa]